MWRTLALLLLVLGDHAWGIDLTRYRLLEVDELSVDYRSTRPGKRDGYMPERDGEWRKGANFNLSLRLLEYLRWDNNLHMDGGESRLYHAGWEYRVILDRYRIQPFMYHHSQHALEDAPRGSSYPVENAYGLRFIFIERKNSSYD